MAKLFFAELISGFPYHGNEVRAAFLMHIFHLMNTWDGLINFPFGFLKG